MNSTTPLKSRNRRALADTLLDTRRSPAERDAELNGVLNEAHHLLVNSHGDQFAVGKAMDGLFGGLAKLKTTCSPEDWQICIQNSRAHAVLPLVHQDPFTARAFAKPRGYAGDAELLDLIYGPEERWPEPVATPLGLDIYRYTANAPAAEGVRARRAFVADLIDQTTYDQPGKHILAIAAGHLREANLTTAVRRRRIGRFVALDADPVSLKEVDRAYGPYGVETVPTPFASLITNRIQLGNFDVIYSTGLFDYLNVNTGKRLVTTLFNMLNPGGQLVVANFMPGIRDIGFMEAFMDWKLIYRTRHDMVELTMDINELDIRDISLFAEENRNIIFLRITKK